MRPESWPAVGGGWPAGQLGRRTGAACLVILRRWETAEEARLDVAELPVASVATNRRWQRTSRQRACGSGGSAWLGARHRKGEARGEARPRGLRARVPLARTPRWGGRRRPGRVRHGHWPWPRFGPGWAKAGRGWAGGRDSGSGC
jgi:hypothetical protein